MALRSDLIPVGVYFEPCEVDEMVELAGAAASAGHLEHLDLSKLRRPAPTFSKDEILELTDLVERAQKDGRIRNDLIPKVQWLLSLANNPPKNWVRLGGPGHWAPRLPRLWEK